MPIEKFEDWAVRLRNDDDVAVAKRTIKAGTELRLGNEGLAISRTIAAGHKLALRALAPGAAVRKYGQIIGFASQEIAPGEHVHTQNLAMRDFARQYEIGVEAEAVR